MKKWYESLTVRGLFLVVIGAVIGWLGLDLDPNVVTDSVLDLIGVAIQGVGVVVAYIGRRRATTPLA